MVPDVGRRNQSERERWLEQVLRRIPSGSRILDAGAGTQRYRKYCQHLQYVSQDFAQYDGQGNGTGLQSKEFDYGNLDIVCDITAIPRPDAYFDAIMCVEVLEHLPEPGKAIQEFSRLLKPGGHLVITAPFCSLTHMAPYHFCTGFSRYWYEKHLEEHRFRIIEIVPNGNFFEYLAQEILRIPYIAEKYALARPHLWEWVSIWWMLRMLYRLSRRDRESAELLCYGYHVYAKKE